MAPSGGRNATALAPVGLRAYASAMEDTVRLVKIRRLAESGALRPLRYTAGFSLSEGGAGAGVDRTTIHRWETGTRRPTGAGAVRYMKLLEELAGV